MKKIGFIDRKIALLDNYNEMNLQCAKLKYNKYRYSWSFLQTVTANGLE